MNESQSTLMPIPEIPVVLALAGPLRPLASAAHPLHTTLRREIASRAGWLIMHLGIPGRITVTLKDGEAGKAPGPMLSLEVNGCLCQAGADPVGRLLDRLANSAGGSRANQGLLPDLIKETCLEILKDQPEVLLELPQAEVVASELPRPRHRKGASRPEWPDAFELLTVMRALRMPLSLGISIADRRAAAQAISANAPLWGSPEDLGEMLAGALSARCVEIRLPEERLPELTLAWQQKGSAAFSQLRFDLAKEIGLNLPPFSFRTEGELASDQFAFQIQHIPGMPFSGLTLENILEKLEAEIRRQMPRLVVLPRVEAQLRLIDSELRDMVEELIPRPRLVRELRLRAQQDGTLRRLPLILEELLDQPFAAAGAPGKLALA